MRFCGLRHRRGTVEAILQHLYFCAVAFAQQELVLTQSAHSVGPRELLRVLDLRDYASRAVLADRDAKEVIGVYGIYVDGIVIPNAMPSGPGGFVGWCDSLTPFARYMT